MLQSKKSSKSKADGKFAWHHVPPHHCLQLMAWCKCGKDLGPGSQHKDGHIAAWNKMMEEVRGWTVQEDVRSPFWQVSTEYDRLGPSYCQKAVEFNR